jgi:CDP-diacylglycerol---glycerol-3-phosphate 3-phosphatidyltransferase
VSLLPDRIAASARATVAPVARRLHALGVTANAVTVVGFLVTLAGAALLAVGQPGAAFIVLAIGTLGDTLDGQLARAAGGGTRFGAFLDSTLDRLSDAALAIAAVHLGATAPHGVLYWSGLLLLVASFLVSYIRAKAESLDAAASMGLAPRESRIVLYLAGLGVWAVTGLFEVFVATVVALALLATVTALQRIAHLAISLSEKKG